VSAPAKPPGLPGRGRELLFLAFGSLAVAVAMTWPALRHPLRTVPQELGDPLYFAWQIAWTGHALVTHPETMYTTNAFAHAPGSLAYTDTILGYAPFVSLVNGLHPGIGGALLAYNLVFVLSVALAFAGGYLLARVLGARVAGALVMAAGYAFAPWHLAHARHLNVISTGGIALALALIAYGHGWTFRRVDPWPADSARAGQVRRGRRVRPGWIVAGWLVACWQLSLGFALGIPFAWVLLLVMTIAVLTWLARGRPAVPRSAVAASGVGAVLFGLTGWLLVRPYLQVVDAFPVAERTEQMVARFSPPWWGLLTAPPESWWWGSARSGRQSAWQSGWRAAMGVEPQEKTLLPGLVLIGLALIGLGYSSWTGRHRVLLAAGVLTAGVLALGTSGPHGGGWTYLPVFRHLPGWGVVRTPGRLTLWTTLALGLLAAGAVTKAVERALEPGSGPRVRSGLLNPGLLRSGLLRSGLLIPAGLVLAEGIGSVPQLEVPHPPVVLRSLPGPVLVLPNSRQHDYLVMTWSTDGWPELVNGGSGFDPPPQAVLREVARTFPQRESVQFLRARGVRTVVLVRSQLAGTPWRELAARPPAELQAQAGAVGIQVRSQDDALIYDLSGR
jgi:hypothetical protein